MAVTLVTSDQDVDALGNTTDVYVITFTAGDPASPYTIRVPQTGDPVTAAEQAIASMTGTVNALYGL